MFVFSAHLAKHYNCSEIHLFSEQYGRSLKREVPIENRSPSKNTIRRVIQIIHPDVLNEVNTLWIDLLAESSQLAT